MWKAARSTKPGKFNMTATVKEINANAADLSGMSKELERRQALEGTSK
jgi:hypothetical protein